MQQLQDLQGAAAIHDAILKETARLKAAEDDFARASAMGGLMLLVPQFATEEPELPKALIEAVPLIRSLLNAQSPSVQAGACGLLGAIMAASESQWRHLALGNHLVPELLHLIQAAHADDTALQINALAALTSAAQGGNEGAQAVVQPGLSEVLERCGGSSSAGVQEAVADLCCQVGSTEACRPGLTGAGAVRCLLQLLQRAETDDVRVRALMGLGMLLPGSSDNQLKVARDKLAVRKLCELMSRSEDEDIRVISRDIFAGLAMNFKDAVAVALKAD